MIRVVAFTGAEVAQWIPEMARLRIEVFAEYPFLYEGDQDAEMRHLKKFLTIDGAVVAVAFDGDQVVGVSTGYPFKYEKEALHKPLGASGRKVEEYFCFGESVLKKPYRGKGIGRRFFEEREAHVARLGYYKGICFYTSTKPEKDPKPPSDYRPLAPFWKRLGFMEHPEMKASVSYKSIGEQKESPKEMVFWIKE